MPPDSSGLGQSDATLPLASADRLRVKLAAPSENHAANRKNERLERRELLYRVVRDSMIRAGVLAASYKFKVLSLDARGRQYLIMMDLFDHTAGDAVRLAEIEALMAQAAKVRHDILVSAVYWRVNEPVTAGLSHRPAAAPVPRAEPDGQAPNHSRPSPRYEPLHQEEVAAFKRALAGAATAESLSPSGQIVTSGRRNPAPPDEFEDTQLVESDDRGSLSTTQYGELN